VRESDFTSMGLVPARPHLTAKSRTEGMSNSARSRRTSWVGSSGTRGRSAEFRNRFRIKRESRRTRSHSCKRAAAGPGRSPRASHRASNDGPRAAAASSDLRSCHRGSGATAMDEDGLVLRREDHVHRAHDVFGLRVPLLGAEPVGVQAEPRKRRVIIVRRRGFSWIASVEAPRARGERQRPDASGGDPRTVSYSGSRAAMRAPWRPSEWETGAGRA
jgi:hypothetical protein